MGEPQIKRAKVPPSSSDEEEENKAGGGNRGAMSITALPNNETNLKSYNDNLMLPISDLEIIHNQLKRKCLCQLELPDILNTLSVCNERFSCQPKSNITNCRKETLLYTSMLALFFEVSLHQKNKGILCSRISEVVSAGADNEGAVIDILFGMIALQEKYISYCAARALAALLLMLRGRPCEVVLEKLVDNIAHSENLLEVGHSIDVVKRIIEWKDLDEHPLEVVEPSGNQPVECAKIMLTPADTQGANEVKYIATKRLECKWFILVTRLTRLISDFLSEKEHVIVSFLTLWESLISVKANLSVTDTKEFYTGLERLMTPLTRQSHTIVWRKVLDLYNEVLCYGSTLALQDVLAEEPCNLAHLIIRLVKDRRFLECVPCGELAGDQYRTETQMGTSAIENGASSSNGNSFNSTITNYSDRTILHKVVLIVLKAIAITVKETRCDSSSENSSRSGGSGSEDVDMAIIERSLRDVLKKLDIFVKSKFPYHPEAAMADWMVKMFADQDDWLVESMVCGLDIYTGLGLSLKFREQPELHAWVNPHTSFIVFLETIYMDHDVLLDLLVSNETHFLLYLLRYLKFLRKTWHQFATECGRRTDEVMSVMIRLRIAIDRLVSKNLFPYKISPILRLLEKCEEIYEDVS